MSVTQIIVLNSS